MLMMAELIFCHHLNLPFNKGIKNIANPINAIPKNTIRTETTIRIANVHKVSLQNTSFLKRSHVVASSFSFAFLKQSQ